MLTEPEAADWDKLFLVFSVPGLHPSRGARKGLFQFPDTDRMGLVQWTPDESSLQINQTPAVNTERDRENESRWTLHLYHDKLKL